MVTVEYVRGTVRGSVTVPVEELHATRVELQAEGAVIVHSLSTR